MSYKTWLKRKENETPYASKANCRKCRYGEWVRTSAFCTGQGKPKKIPYKAWDTDRTGYCPEFIPKGGCTVTPMIANGMKMGSAKGLCNRQGTQRCTSGRIGTDGNCVMTSRMKRRKKSDERR